MSTLLLNTLTGKTSAGSIVVTGEGGSTTTNMQQGLVKAWLNLDGDSTASIVDNLNVGSLTDNGTGSFTITNDHWTKDMKTVPLDANCEYRVDSSARKIKITSACLKT